MIEGWDVVTRVETYVNKYLISLEAEPAFAQIDEKIRNLTAELHQRILSQELQWSLMMTPLSMVKDLQRMCEGEIARREEELKALTKDIDLKES